MKTENYLLTLVVLLTGLGFPADVLREKKTRRTRPRASRLDFPTRSRKSQRNPNAVSLRNP